MAMVHIWNMALSVGKHRSRCKTSTDIYSIMMDNQFTIRKLISSTSSDYEVQELLGCGAYGAVTKCRKVATNEMVALKILKRTDYIDFAKQEAETLTWMKQLNSEKFNIVVLNDSFTFEGRFHLEFEKLDISLYQFMEMRSSDSLKLQEIRPIVQQLATALEFIKHAGVVHADLKPENIMMVDHVWQPLRIKIIDFGIACRDPEARTGQILQTLWYRSPEILLGAPFNTAIDTWSLGCIAAEMKLGKLLFPGSDEYDMSTYEIDKSDCVRHTIFGLDFFLRALHDVPEEDAGADECDRANFVDLLKKMLTVDSSERITPSQILQHPFITMSHLVGTFDNSPYVKSSVELMKHCNVLSSDDGEETTSNSLALHPDEGHAAGLSKEEQLCLQSIHENSPAKKRKRDCSEDSESGNRSPIATKRRSQCQYAADTVRHTHPLLRKRQRDESDQRSSSDSNSQKTKKRCINLDKEPMDSATELQSNTREAPSSSTQIQCVSSSVKSSVDLMKYCNVLSSDDGEEMTSNSPALHPNEGQAAGLSEEEQLCLQSIHENSPAKKRKRDCSEDSESGNRSPIATKRRSLCQYAADTVRHTHPLLRKRQRDESDQRSSSDSNSQKTKKRRINLDKEPMDSATELLSDTQEAPSSSTQVQSLKRKRADEEATSPEEEKTSCPDKEEEEEEEEGEFCVKEKPD
ncbi:hypothetical protein ABVT39_009117 [Epinephelus coioides]